MREDPRFCISNEFLIDAEAARSGTTHPEVKKEFKKRKKEKKMVPATMELIISIERQVIYKSPQCRDELSYVIGAILQTYAGIM